MEGLGSVWSGLDMRKKVIVVAATLAVFAAVLGLSRGPDRDLSLLYAGLDGNAAGDVLAALDQRSAVYEVRGGAIYVDAAQRDLLRMSLAGEGLPANGAQGYELLDSLSGFGTTSQMFDAAYWRAKEGELARTIEASAGVRAARVHISTPSSRGFRRDETASAAVTITTNDGTLSAARAKALRFLVASAVPGLVPDDVAVIDGDGSLVGNGDEPDTPGAASDREAEMRARVARLLEARVGFGNAVVELSIETETDSEQILERVIDPDSRVAISTELQESSGSSTDTRSAVTVASNLPDGDAAEGDGQSQSQNSETVERTNFEISETQREITRGPGAIKRLTVAVLVNDVVSTDATGAEIITPRAEEELTALHDLVASAVGYDEARGDVITIRSMAFEPTEPMGTEAGTLDLPATPLDVMRLAQLGVMAVVALILGLFVVRPILTGKGSAAPAPMALEPPPPVPGSANLPAVVGASSAPGSDVDFGGTPRFDVATYDAAGAEGAAEEEDLSKLDPVTRLRRMMTDRQDETMQILQSWVDEDDKEKVV